MPHLEDILKKLGWNSGFQVPVANVENQQLEAELVKLSLRKIETKNALDKTNERLKNIKEHFKFVQQENEQTQKLITAHKQQHDTEENRYHTLKSENHKIDHDICQTKKRIQFLNERKSGQQVELQRALAKVEKLRQETDWDIEALKAWDETIKKRDEDNELIKKISKEDERKFNEFEAKRQFLQNEYDTKMETVRKLMSEIHSDEMIIEKLSKSIKQQLNQREALINQWKDTVKMLQQRDTDIDNEQEQILELNKLLEQHREQLKEANDFLENEKRNCCQIEIEIEKLNLLNSKFGQEISDVEQDLLMISSENEAQKRRLAASGKVLDKARLNGKKIQAEIELQENFYEKYKEEKTDLQAKLKEMKSDNLSSSDRINKIQKIIDSEEKYCKAYLSDTIKINSNLHRLQQLLKERQSTGKTIEINISNCYCVCNKLRKRIADDGKELQKLKEVIYDMDFRIDEFEAKLGKIEGTNKQEQDNVKEEKIRELEKQQENNVAAQHKIQNQVNRLQDEMRKLWTSITTDKKQLEILENKVENYLLLYENGRKQITAAKKATEEKQVEENLMQLRINHIMIDMEVEEDHIFDLQKFHLSINQIMKERQLEIDTKKSIVQAQKKNLEEDKGRLKSDISLKQVKLEQLKKKYHVELMSLGKDENGEPFSLTHFRVKHAQEKVMLQQRGDELDNQIKVAEKEILAMENTLKMVNLTNVAFKYNLEPVKDDDVENQEKITLENELKDSVTKLKNVKKEITNQQAIIGALQKDLRELEVRKIADKDKLSQLEDEHSLIENQESDKAEKVQRTEKQVKKTLKLLRGKDLSIYDKDLAIRQLSHSNNQVLMQLLQLAERHTDIAPFISRLIEEQQLDVKSYSSLSSYTLSSSLMSSSLSTSTSSSSSLNRSTASVNSSKNEMRTYQYSIQKVDISWNGK